MTGPLPGWRPVDGWGSGTFEATAPDGTVWRLWLIDQANKQAGYRLAPADGSSASEFISDAGGLYAALDRAGMRIAADAVRADPEGARRQLGLDAETETT